ncbi:amidohydrolase family protein [Novosphingobium sp.]|uniref:amidohydrolase family protein n=1 Tax=Novosphingobium sp. TaxID=1874826 RepID=UPI002732D709|nr:amidohydrolase family protein [Novosphingobium sp.]MDP3905921.1 amidohydrolase family protein [Novosphingobium sp.]
MLDATAADIFPLEGHGAPNDRLPQTKGDTGLPAGTLVFSADDHVSVGDDIFYDNFPANLKEYAPRLWRDEDGVFQIGMNGKSFLPPAFSEVVSHFERRPGCNAANVEARLADMDAEGVDKSLVFPNEVLATLAFPDHNLRELCFQIYNEYIAEWQAKAPDRLYAVGLINWWDPAGTRRSLEQLKSLGLKTFLLPLNAFTFPDGTKIDYAGKAMIPVWEEIEASGIPVSHHIGEGDFGYDEHNRIAAAMIQLVHSFREMFGKYVFGGILDRHPGLKVGWFEGGINWAVSTVQDATFLDASVKHTYNWPLKHTPEYYWRNNMSASFMIDPLGLEMIDRVGVENAYWSTDYPHNESTLGYTRSSLRSVVEAVGVENATKIAGANIAKFLGV